MKALHLWADGVYREHPESGVLVTRLDDDGRPVADSTVHLRGPIRVHFTPDEEAE